MAKKAKTDLISEHYNIHVMRVPLDQVGHVLATLTKMGIVEVAPELVTNVKSYKTNKSGQQVGGGEARRKFEKNGDEKIIDELSATKKPLDIKEIKAAFIAEGRSPLSVSSQLYGLLKKRTIKRTGSGAYELNRTPQGKAAIARLLKGLEDRRAERQAKAAAKLDAQVVPGATANGHANGAAAN